MNEKLKNVLKALNKPDYCCMQHLEEIINLEIMELTETIIPELKEEIKASEKKLAIFKTFMG